MSKLNEISGDLLAIANLPPENRNKALLDLSLVIQGWADYEIEPAQKDLITSIIVDLIGENDAEQIAKSKSVFVEEVEEQIAPTIKTRKKKVVAPVVETISEDLPDFIELKILIKNLPEPVKKLVLFRQKQQNLPFNEDVTLLLDDKAFRWVLTPERSGFWQKIEDEGDLREFKEKYGNKGEKVDEIIEFEELNEFVQTLTPPVASTPTPTPTPSGTTQLVKYVEVIVYPPSGGVLNIKVFSVGETMGVFDYLWDRLQMKKLIFNISAITDYSTYTTQIEVKTSESGAEIFEKLIAQFDTFVKPELDWEMFGNRNTDDDIVALNTEILKDSFKPKVAPVVTPTLTPAPVVTPKPVKVVTPKPVKVVVPKVVTPKPVKVVAPKVEIPKPVKVVVPKAPKVVKQKVTKPKVEDDLSFLNDLDNIF